MIKPVSDVNGPTSLKQITTKKTKK